MLGITQKPAGTDLTFSFDYFSLRGPAAGSTFSWQRESVLGLPGPSVGFLDAFGIYDHGLDQLGGPLFNLKPDEDFRGRVLARNRTQLPDNWRLTTEIGKISDRNFLEEYFAYEWQAAKNQSTGVELKRLVDNMSYSISADVRLNTFFTETNNLPRLDHYWLGQPLLGDRLTWFEHSQASYSQLRIESVPVNTIQTPYEEPLAWERKSQGQVLSTRNEIDAPLDAGPFKFVPYAFGELSNIGQDLTQQELSRGTATLGLRGSIPFWTANPAIESEFFNVHGVAHKIVFDVDAFATQTSAPLSDMPLYQQLDDNSQLYFERMFRTTTYNGLTPMQFDSRYYCAACQSRQPSNVSFDRDRKRSGRGSLGRPPALANQAWPAQQPSHHRLDHVRYRKRILPQSESRQFRRRDWTDELRLPLARG